MSSRPALTSSVPPSTHILIDVKQLIDLSLGTPEIGVVNFNLLHSLLHVVATQLNIQDTKIEFRGDENGVIRSLVETAPKGPTVEISEYVVEKRQSKKKESVEVVEVVTEPAREEEPPAPPTPPKLPTPEPSVHSQLEKGDVPPPEPDPPEVPVVKSETIIVVERVSVHQEPAQSGSKESTGLKKKTKSDSKHLAVVTASQHSILEQKVKSLTEQLSVLMPENNQLLEAVRSKGSTKSVTEMWQLLNVTARLEAAETGIEKLSTMVEDLALEYTKVSERIGFFQDVIDQIPPIPEVIPMEEESIHSAIEMVAEDVALETDRKTSEEKKPPSEIKVIEEKKPPSEIKVIEEKKPPSEIKVIQEKRPPSEIKVIEEKRPPSDIKVTEKRLLSEDFVSDKRQSSDKKVTEKRLSSERGLTKSPSIVEMIDGLLKDFGVLKLEVEELGNLFAHFKSSIPEEILEVENPVTERRSSRLDEKFGDLTNNMARLDTAFNRQMNIMQDQMGDLEKEVSEMWKKVAESLKHGGPLEEEPSGVGEFFNKVQALQEDIEALNSTVSKLFDEKECNKLHIHELYEQLGVLKAVKAEKEDVKEQLADKADLAFLNTKVSVHQFDSAYSSMSEALNEACDKLQTLEIMWQRALEEVQNDMINKLEKGDFFSFKGLVEKQLKVIQDRVAELARVKKEAEAAGIKKMIRNVNCISCDNDVVMMRNASSPQFPISKPMPAHRSLNPYQTYELDDIRKFQKSFPQSRNMNDWEAMEKQMNQLSRPETHLVNRYCGGSHTVTTAQQRLAKSGNYIKQWGPEAVPLTSGTVKAKDGKIYKITEVLQMKDQSIMTKMSDAQLQTHSPAKPIAEPVKAASPMRQESTAHVTSKQRLSKTSVQGAKIASVHSIKKAASGTQSEAAVPAEVLPAETPTTDVPEGETETAQVQEGEVEGGTDVPTEVPGEGEAAPPQAPPVAEESTEPAPEAPAEAPVESSETPAAEEAPATDEAPEAE